jgi:acyl-CoA thioesterase YciA
MDLAGGIAGAERARRRVVTVAVDGMHLIRPVKVGDIPYVDTSVDQVGRTSITVAVEARTRRFRTRVHKKVTSAIFTFVAVDDAGKLRAVPPARPTMR